jgi:hypothetical protein
MEALIFYTQARQALAQAVKVDEVKTIRNQAEALRCYIKQAGELLETQNWCAEIKIRAERRIGELLDQDPQLGSGKTRRLRVFGIDKDQSSRCQAIASLPLDLFEAHIAQTKAAGREVTSAAVYRETRKRQPVSCPPRSRHGSQNPAARWPRVQGVTNGISRPAKCQG